MNQNKSKRIPLDEVDCDMDDISNTDAAFLILDDISMPEFFDDMDEIFHFVESKGYNYRIVNFNRSKDEDGDYTINFNLDIVMPDDESPISFVFYKETYGKYIHDGYEV